MPQARSLLPIPSCNLQYQNGARQPAHPVFCIKRPKGSTFKGSWREAPERSRQAAAKSKGPMPVFGAKSRAMRDCASKLACGRRIGPADCTVTSLQFSGRQSRRPLQQVFQSAVFCRGGRLCPPAECADFSEIFGKFRTFRRADVGIGPYKGRRFMHSPRPAGMSRRP